MIAPATAPVLSLVPPAPTLENTKAEQALLGALLARCVLIDHLPAGFASAHYADPWHAELHEAIVAARLRGATGAVAVELLHVLGLADTEKQAYLATLLTAMIGTLPSHVQSLARAVSDMWKRRELHAQALRLLEVATSNLHDPVDAALASHMVDLSSLAERVLPEPDEDVSAAVETTLAASQAARQNGNRLPGYGTGMASVDRRIRGLQPGTMNVLGGRPGMGKTALAVQWAVGAAEQGAKVAILSLEMTKTQLAQRMVSFVSGVPGFLIEEGRFNAEQGERIALAQARLSRLRPNLRIADRAGLTVGEIGLRARALALKMGGLDVFVVDHLHIVKPEGADVRAGATWAVGRVSTGMKQVAKDTGAAGLILAQLNRGVEGRDDKRPNMADLRQAGDIEQDADTFSFLYRAEYYEPKTPPEKAPTQSDEKHQQAVNDWHNRKARLAGLAELICAKVRGGEPGTVLLNFDGPTTSFSERAHG